MQPTLIAPAPPVRSWEIDVARGLAVICMVFFHLMWELGYLGLSNVNVFTPAWQFFARSIGSSFTFLLGVSVAVRYTNQRTKGSAWLVPMVRRGLLIFGYGLLITLATYLVVGEQFVVFGILHMQGIALIVAAFTVRLPRWLSGTLGFLMIGIGLFLNTLTAPYPWLIWLGLTEQGRTMVDYYPLLPWGGFALLGSAVGAHMYRSGASTSAFAAWSTLAPIRALRLLGRHSLPIYLSHQPLLLGFLMVWVWLAQL